MSKHDDINAPNPEQTGDLHENKHSASKGDDGGETAGEAGGDNTADFLSKIGFQKKGAKGHDHLKQENEELKQQVGELNDKFLRLYAEFDNFKKRSTKERIEWFKTAAQDVITDLLPVVDDFSRAIKQMETANNAAALKDGVVLIQSKLKGILESRGLKAMECVGADFNPDLHDAITEIEVKDESMKGKVVEEVVKGYYLSDKIIRHAKVVVGK